MDVVGRMMNEQLDFQKIRKDYKFHAFKTNIEKMLKESQLERVKIQLADVLKIDKNVSTRKEKTILDDLEQGKQKGRRKKQLSPKQVFFERQQKKNVSHVQKSNILFQ
jgi:hypothetical protein